MFISQKKKKKGTKTYKSDKAIPLLLTTTLGFYTNPLSFTVLKVHTEQPFLLINIEYQVMVI